MSLVIKTKNKLPTTVTAPAVVVTTTKKAVSAGKGRNKKRRGKGRGQDMPVYFPLRASLGQGGNDLFNAYVSTLNDPWTFNGLRLGFGTMVPTNLATVYARSSIPVNSADGSLSMFLIPSSGAGGSNQRAGLYFNNSGLSFATWSNVTTLNGAVARLMGSESRVISAGIKTFASIAGTAPPGVCYLSYAPSTSYNTMSSCTPATLGNDPVARMADAREAVAVCTRPVDMDSYQFQPANASGYNDASATYNSIPIITYVGCPNTTTVFFDVVINLEILPVPIPNYASTVTNTASDSSYSSLLSDYFPSVDQLWRAARQAVSDPVVITSAFSSVASLAAGGYALTGHFSNQAHVLRAGKMASSRLVPL